LAGTTWPAGVLTAHAGQFSPERFLGTVAAVVDEVLAAH